MRSRILWALGFMAVGAVVMTLLDTRAVFPQQAQSQAATKRDKAGLVHVGSPVNGGRGHYFRLPVVCIISSVVLITFEFIS